VSAAASCPPFSSTSSPHAKPFIFLNAGIPFALRRFASPAAAAPPRPRLTETLIAPVLSAPPLAQVVGAIFCADRPKNMKAAV
jgi:hypothetical protein